MKPKRLIVLMIYIMLLISVQFIFISQSIYAEEIQQFNGYNSDLNFDLKADYEYKILEYDFLSKEKRSLKNHFINNFAYINQLGNQNQSSICQLGIFGSVVEIIQIGNKNKADLKQYANNTTAEVFQFGDNHDLSVEQWGSEGKIYVIQSGINLENKEIKIIQF